MIKVKAKVCDWDGMVIGERIKTGQRPAKKHTVRFFFWRNKLKHGATKHAHTTTIICGILRHTGGKRRGEEKDDKNGEQNGMSRRL